MKNFSLHRLSPALLAFLYSLLLGALYASVIQYLVHLWGKEDFSYGLLIPFIAAYLVWERRKTLAAVPSCPSWTGLLPLAAGLGLFWLGELGGEFTVLFISLWMVAVGLLWMHLGFRKLRLLQFPVLFSLTMFPPPNALYAPVLLKLKLLSSQIGVGMMQLSGMSAYREGNIIDLGFTRLQVVDACSGLRFAIPLLLMGILLACFARIQWWKKLILVASTLPLAVFTNSLRIAATGILYQWWGAAVAEGFFHDFSGWIIFVVSLAVLLGILKVLGGRGGSAPAEGGGQAPAEPVPGVNEAPVEGRGQAPAEPVPGVNEAPVEGGGQAPSEPVPGVNEAPVEGGGQAPAEPVPAVPGGRGTGTFGASPLAVISLVLIGGTLVLMTTVNFREEVPTRQALGDFPLEIGEWRGERGELDSAYLDVLHLSDYLLVDYRSPAEKEISLYVAYNASQRKGESTHSPSTCLPGSGWILHDAGLVNLPQAGAGAEAMEVRRAMMEKTGEKRLTYYWFPQRGRMLTNMFELKLFTFWDALTRQRTDGALVRVITPLYPGEGTEEAEGRLRDFLQQAVPMLEGYLPG